MTKLSPHLKEKMLQLHKSMMGEIVEAKASSEEHFQSTGIQEAKKQDEQLKKQIQSLLDF